MLKILGRYLPPTLGVKPPSLWGVEAHIQSLLGQAASAIQVRPVMFNFRYRSAEHFVDIFRTWYGPVHIAFAAVAPGSSSALKSDLIKLVNHMSRGGERSLVVPSEYHEIVITRS